MPRYFLRPEGKSYDLGVAATLDVAKRLQRPATTQQPATTIVCDHASAMPAYTVADQTVWSDGKVTNPCKIDVGYHKERPRSAGACEVLGALFADSGHSYVPYLTICEAKEVTLTEVAPGVERVEIVTAEGDLCIAALVSGAAGCDGCWAKLVTDATVFKDASEWLRAQLEQALVAL